MTTLDAPVDVRRGSDYATLCRTIRATGLLDRRLVWYSIRGLLTFGAFAAIWVAVVVIGDSWYTLVAAGVLGLASTHVAFLGHDAGHQQIFTSRRANDIVGRTAGNLLVGLSYGWWVDTHNRHHANPNHEGRDPDFSESVLTFTSAQAAERTDGLSGFFARHQAWLFFPLLTLEGISLHVDSIVAVKTGRYRSARGGSRRFETIGLFTDFAFGGLNYQIERHLFPNMPRASLRDAQPIVRAYCEAVGVSYCETSLTGSYRAGLGHLNDVGAPLRAVRNQSTAAGPIVGPMPREPGSS
jgi:fatty acid desaturase